MCWALGASCSPPRRRITSLGSGSRSGPHHPRLLVRLSRLRVFATMLAVVGAPVVSRIAVLVGDVALER